MAKAKKPKQPPKTDETVAVTMFQSLVGSWFTGPEGVGIVVNIIGDHIACKFARTGEPWPTRTVKVSDTTSWTFADTSTELRQIEEAEAKRNAALHEDQIESAATGWRLRSYHGMPERHQSDEQFDKEFLVACGKDASAALLKR